MSFVSIALDSDDLVAMYKSGESSDKIAEQMAVSRTTVLRRLRAAGVQIRPRGWPEGISYAKAIPQKAIQRYLDGELMSALIKELGVSRCRFRRALIDAGYQPRTMSQIVGMRWNSMTVSERRSQVAKAHIAKKGRPATQKTLERRARTMESTMQLASRADLLLGIWLAQRGILFTPQKAVGPYNIDLAIQEPLVAVEVNGDWHYFPDRQSSEARRREYLLSSGWRLIEVALTSLTGKPWKYLRPACADKIVSLLKDARANESTWGQYCVIGGDGEPLTSRGKNTDDVATVSTAISAPNS